MKNYSNFLKEEITIKGNPGVPGEGKDAPRDETKYLRGVEDEGRRMAGGIDDQMLAMGYGRQIMQMVQQNMQLMIGDICDPDTFYRGRGTRQQLERVQARFAQLEELAEELIRLHYPEILSDVELDIKLVVPRKVAEFMEEGEQETPPKPNFQELKDPNIQKEVHKRKMANAVMQGEAKNAKHMLHHEMVIQKLTEMYGDRKAHEIFDLWDRITGIADKMDWLVPIDIKADMMEQHPEGFAGSERVDWVPEKPKEKKDEKEKGNEEGKADPEEEKEGGFVPVIRARGIDFPMLLHETVKGLYEIISAKGIPQDKRTAEIALLNTGSFEDEAEDFRYGPKIAADLRDFINLSRNIDKYPNLREHTYGKMMEMPADNFLKLIKGILSKSAESRKKVDEMVLEVIAELDKWELQQTLPSYEEPDNKYIEDGDVAELPDNKPEEKPAEPKVVDYSTLSKKRLQDIVDDALERGDFETLSKVGPFLKIKENLMWKIYESEINRVLKS